MRTRGLTLTGVLDSTYGTGGTFFTNFPTLNIEVSNMSLDSATGKIMILGRTNPF